MQKPPTSENKEKNILAQVRKNVHLIFASIPLGLVMFRDNGAILAVNKALVTLIEQSEKELVAININSVFSSSCRDKLKEAITNLSPEQAQALSAMEIRTKSGEIVMVDVLISRLNDDTEKNFIATIGDATERIRLEQLRLQLLSMVSHDLRAPLTSIRSFCELLSQGMYGEISEVGLERLSVVEQNIDRLTNMVKELLDKAQLESGVFSLNYSACDCLVLCMEAIGSLKEMFDKKCISVKIVRHTEGELKVTADRERLLQVLINLLANALTYSQEGAQIIMTLGLGDQDTGELSVEDNGPGISEKNFVSIFEPYNRAGLEEGKLKPTKQGYGLGLAICKQLIEMQGGTIGCRSILGQGSTFWMRLPLANDYESLD